MPGGYPRDGPPQVFARSGFGSQNGHCCRLCFFWHFRFETDIGRHRHRECDLVDAAWFRHVVFASRFDQAVAIRVGPSCFV